MSRKALGAITWGCPLLQEAALGWVGSKPLAELRRTAQPGTTPVSWQAYTMKANSWIVMTERTAGF